MNAYKIDPKYPNVYLGILQEKVPGTIGNSSIPTGEHLLLVKCTSLTGNEVMRGISTSGRKDYCQKLETAKRQVTLVRVDNRKTPDQILSRATEIHNDRVY